MKAMKFLAVCFTLVGLYVFSVESQAHHLHDRFDRVNHATQVVNVDFLNVRRGPGRGYRAFAVLRLGERVEVLRTSHRWAKVQFRGYRGWVSQRHLRPIKRHHRHAPRKRFGLVNGNRFGFAFMFSNITAIVHRCASVSGERVRIPETWIRWTLVAKRGIGRGYVRTGCCRYKLESVATTRARRVCTMVTSCRLPDCRYWTHRRSPKADLACETVASEDADSQQHPYSDAGRRRYRQNLRSRCW